MLRNGRLFRKARKYLKSVTGFEKRVTIMTLLLWLSLEIVTYFLVLPGDITPSGIKGKLQNVISYLKYVVLLGFPILLILRRVCTENPAESVSIKNIQKKFPELWSDIYSLTQRAQLRFHAEQLQFADSDEAIRMISYYNSIMFSDSAHYSGNYDKKLFRNKGIYRKYEKCFAFVVDTHGYVEGAGETVGLSIVVPLKPNSAALYRQGKISDHDINEYHIAKRGEPCGCILLFAIGLMPSLQAKRTKSLSAKSIRLLLRSHIYHAYQVGEDFGLDSVKYVVQIEKSSIARLVKQFGFIKLANKGGDKDDLYELSWRGVVGTVKSA